jgi:hypothetical protein
MSILLALLLILFLPVVQVSAQSVWLEPAPPLTFPGQIDSNSPAFWQFVWGQNRLHLVMSWWTPSISRGFSVNRLGNPWAVRFLNSDAGGKWIEAVLQDEAGTLYGYYHHEPLGLCPGTTKTAPRIGAARSTDNGFSWVDLGIILEHAAPLDCETPNQYFAGGIGDFTVILNNEKTDAYFLFTVYSGHTAGQGVAMARMSWPQRDAPHGNLALWDGETWRSSPRSTTQIRRRFFEPRPIYPASVSWHDRSGGVDSFWGPSVHWNTFLSQYVILLNRASDSDWSQEGIYIAFSPVLEDPKQWTTPVKIVDGGPHYPQVMGLERNEGTDKLAGERARLFLRGQSDYFIVFQKPD